MPSSLDSHEEYMNYLRSALQGHTIPYSLRCVFSVLAELYPPHSMREDDSYYSYLKSFEKDPPSERPLSYTDYHQLTSFESNPPTEPPAPAPVRNRYLPRYQSNSTVTQLDTTMYRRSDQHYFSHPKF